MSLLLSAHVCAAPVSFASLGNTASSCAHATREEKESYQKNEIFLLVKEDSIYYKKD